MQVLNNNSIVEANLISMNSWYRKLAFLFGLIAIADWLFYGQELGITITCSFAHWLLVSY